MLIFKDSMTSLIFLITRLILLNLELGVNCPLGFVVLLLRELDQSLMN